MQKAVGHDHQTMDAQPNNPQQAGELASDLRLIGNDMRYAVYAEHTRGNDVRWFVADTQTLDPTCDLPSIIRQAETYEQAVEGLLD